MKTLHGKEARIAIKKGVDIVANAVKVTLGPKGNNVLIQNIYGAPTSTKDGVTVAKALDLDDPVFDMGAQLIKEAAAQTVDQVGDGTTTVTVLTQALLKAGFNLVDYSHKSIDIKRAWLDELKVVIDHLTSISTPVKGNPEMLANVARISANNDTIIGDLVADVFQKVGEDGGVKVVASDQNKVETIITNGSTYDNGYLTPHFVTNETTMKTEYIDANILVVDGRITKGEIFFEMLHKAQEQPLLIICNEIDNESLSLAVLNAQQANLKLVIVTSPGFGDARRSLLNDICVTTGATLLDNNSIKECAGRLELAFGSAANIIVTKDDFCIINGKNYSSEFVNQHVEMLKTQRDNPNLLKHDKDFIDKRIASLIGKVGTIKVGANSEIEMNELKDRIDDAVSATAAALSEGVIVGGGYALYNFSIVKINETKDEILKAFYMALTTPAVVIADNAGIQIKDHNWLNLEIADISNMGTNADTGEYTNLITEGVIDPVKVTKTALTTAVSIAATVLTTECLIYKDYNGK